MKPTGTHNKTRADDARMIDDDGKQQTEEGRSAVHAAPRAPIHAAASAEHKHSDSSSMAESKQQETATTEPSPAPSTGRSKRVREPQAEAAPAAADPVAATAPAAAASSSSRSSKQARTAAASSVQQQKADSASTKEKGSGRRGARAEPKQRGVDESAEEAAAASASSAPKRKSAAATSSKSAASSKSTAASAASSRPSPFSRLDADSLGIALSCLDANEFLVARLVSKQWHAASAKRTAWPRLQVNDFIRLMQTDSYDDPRRRRLVVDSDDKLRSFVERFSAHPFQDVFGKHASEVKLSLDVSGSPKAVAARQALLLSILPILASQFQFLSALTLDGCDLEKEAIKPLFKALRPLLRVLILSNCGRALYRQVAHLKQLRVLVMDTLPPAEALRSLILLRYLHVRVSFAASVPFTSNHGRVLRWLSVHHALRSLSIERPPAQWGEVRVNELLALTEAEATRTHPLQRALPIAPIALDPPLDFTVPARFTDLSISNLSDRLFDHWDHVPDLHRLEFEQPLESGLLGICDWYSDARYRAHSVAVRQMLPRLTELRVLGRFSEHLQTLSVAQTLLELRACTSLRRLNFTTNLIDEERTGKQAKPNSLPPLLRAFSATIAEIRLGVEIRIAFEKDAEGEDELPVKQSVWSSLAICKHLRVLEISFSDSMPDSFLRALSSLPVFHSLELSFRSDLPSILPTMLQRMLESHTWSALHLISVGHPEPRRFDPLQPRSQTGLKAQLADLQRDSPHLLSPKLSNRIRLYVHLSTQSRVRTYRIVTDEDTGTLAWESDQ